MLDEGRCIAGGVSWEKRCTSSCREKSPFIVSDAAAVPTRRPELRTFPSARINPVSGVIGRTKDILNSSVVLPNPFSNVDWMASPMQLSSSVAVKPPCTVPDGLRSAVVGTEVTTTRPCSASVTSYPRVWAILLSGSVPSASPDKFEAGHFLLLINTDGPVGPVQRTIRRRLTTASMIAWNGLQSAIAQREPVDPNSALPRSRPMGVCRRVIRTLLSFFGGS